MLDAIRRLIQRYGFFKRAEPRSYFDHIPSPTDSQRARWAEGARNIANDPAYRALAANQLLNLAPSAVKNRRLAQIARERDALKVKLAKAIRQKTKRSGIYAEIKALKTEEMRLEAGK